MHQLLKQILEPESEYSQLPQAIRDTFSEREYLFMSDREKAALTQTETEPEIDL